MLAGVRGGVSGRPDASLLGRRVGGGETSLLFLSRYCAGTGVSYSGVDSPEGVLELELELEVEIRPEKECDAGKVVAEQVGAGVRFPVREEADAEAEAEDEEREPAAEASVTPVTARACRLGREAVTGVAGDCWGVLDRDLAPLVVMVPAVLAVLVLVGTQRSGRDGE